MSVDTSRFHERFAKIVPILERLSSCSRDESLDCHLVFLLLSAIREIVRTEIGKKCEALESRSLRDIHLYKSASDSVKSELSPDLKEKISVTLGELLCRKEIARSGDRSNKCNILEILEFFAHPSVFAYIEKYKWMVMNSRSPNLISGFTNILFQEKDLTMANSVLEEISK